MCCVIQDSMNKGFQESQTVGVSAQTHGESCSLVIGPSVGSRVDGNLNIIERLSILKKRAGGREKMENNRADN